MGSPDKYYDEEHNGSRSHELERWIAEAHQGEPEALGRLLQTCREYLMLVANQELASDVNGKIGPSDVVQETLLEAHRDFAGFRGQSEKELFAWLRRILLHNLLNQHRQFLETQKRAVSREVDPGIADVRDRTAGDDTPSQQAIQHEESVLLEAALKRLPDHYRRVIELRNREGRSFAEIGQLVDRSADAARMLWSRAFEQLARELDTLK